MPPFAADQVMQTAVRHHQAGEFSQAEALYREVLQHQPKHPIALHLLGVVALQSGRSGQAVELIKQALAVGPNWPEALSNLGHALTNNGQFDEAIAACRRALALEPRLSEAYCNLGNAFQAKGQLDEAIATYRQALALKHDSPEIQINLGKALQAKGQLEEAKTAFRQVITLQPKNPEGHARLGKILQVQGQLVEAVAAYYQAIALNSNDPEVHYDLGVALQALGRADEAMAAYRKTIVLSPNSPEPYTNLGIMLSERGQFADAIAAHQKAIALQPQKPDDYNNLGLTLRSMDQLDEAINLFRQAIALNPGYAEAYSNLGIALKDKGQVDEAVAAYRQALALKPNFPNARYSLGVALADKGQLDEAIAAYREALALKPDWAEAHCSLVYTLYFHPGFDARAIADEHDRWNRQHAERFKKMIQPHHNERDPERRLRIGYVSPDFRNHCQSFFTVPLLTNHDHRSVEVFAYADVARPDGVTQRVRACCDQWRLTSGHTDDEIAEMIRADRIDILVDLTLHMAHNRLLVFARKPAPVQVTWLGFPGSTGLTTMDYRLSDPYLDPPGMDESVYSERTIRLPDSFWCYDPLDGRDIPVNSLPALGTGVVTFGNLNNFSKIHDAVLCLWAQVLHQVEGSRLLLLAPEGAHRQRTLERLRQEGIAPARVEFVANQPRRKYLEEYHRIDLGLDSFPSNGHTTSLDSCWMGVPVVTVVGERAVARAGWCQLSNLGLPELAGQSPEDFVRIAVGLAKDLPRLQQLRATLRQRMEQSPLMDGARFARNIEAAYRQMWRTWCARAE